MIERTPEQIRPTYRSSASFCLHLGNYGSQGIVAIVGGLVAANHWFGEPLEWLANGGLLRRRSS